MHSVIKLSSESAPEWLAELPVVDLKIRHRATGLTPFGEVCLCFSHGAVDRSVVVLAFARLDPCSQRCGIWP